VDSALAYCPDQFRSPVSIPDLKINALVREETLINPSVQREALDPKGESTPDNLLHTVPLFYKIYQVSLIEKETPAMLFQMKG
jgi:hypothetical protein